MGACGKDVAHPVQGGIELAPASIEVEERKDVDVDDGVDAWAAHVIVCLFHGCG